MLAFWKNFKTSDTRNARRFKTHCLIKYGLANNPAAKKNVVSPRDISSSGLLFVSDLSFQKDILLEIDIYLPPFKEFFTVMGSIIRAVKIKGTDQYLIAVRFSAIDPRERGEIEAYINDLSDTPGMQRFLDKKSKIVKRQLGQ